MSRTKIRNAVIVKANSYCKRSTLHGFFYFYNSKSICIYLIWSTIITCSIALCAFLSNMIWQKFVVDPTFVVVQTTHYSMSDIPFPAVTVCSSEVVYGPHTTNITNILRMRGYQTEQIEEFYTSFKSVQGNYNEPKKIVSEMHLTFEKLGVTYDDLLETLTIPCNDLLIRCAWRTQTFDCVRMFQVVRYFIGYCCRFEMNYFKLQVDEDTNFVSGIAMSEALTFEVNHRKAFPNGTTDDGFVSIYITPEHQVISVDSIPTSVSGPAYIDINVGVWVMQSSADVEALSIEDRQCVLENSVRYLLDKDPTETSSFKHDCLTTSVIQETVSICKCLPFNITSDIIKDEYPRCSWERMNCIYQNFNKVHVEMWNEIRTKCYQSCNKVKYETVVDNVKSQGRVWQNGSSCTVSVHFNDNTCMVYRREVLYTWDQMLANLGGIFGLCLGGSLISIIEIVWFFSDIIYTIITKAKENKIADQKKEDLFVIKMDSKLKTFKKSSK